jgi:2-polyprenyl-3-methyl-5-hydroxy-6-metoxy-1,4-benzoquinol methylase
MDFLYRSNLPEKMDDPGVSVHEIHKALNELEVINRYLGGYNVILNGLNKLDWRDQTLTIMDLGSGGGDMLRSINDWAHSNGKKVRLIGVDWNPVMNEYAEERSKGLANISYKTVSVWDDELLNNKVDVVISSLFCHHFDDIELIRLISRMNEMSKMAVIINDLHRHWFAYHSIKAITRLFSKTYLVKYDGPLSVARALTQSEWEYVLNKAGVNDYSISWMWAWRWQIHIKK